MLARDATSAIVLFASFDECRDQPGTAYGFQYVADGTRFESIHRVLVVRCRENHGRCSLECIQMMRGLDAIKARHAYVEQDNIGFTFGRN
jgi:hypothetical protein